MNLRERIRKRFRQLGLSYLRLPESEADVVADAVAWSHDRLGAFADFCCGPAARGQDLNRAILFRWLETVPVLLPLPAALARKAITPWPHASFSSQALEAIYLTASQVAVGGLALPEPDASHFADGVMLSASPAFAFYQRCMAPQDHTLEVLARSLLAYTGVFPYAAAAHQLCAARRADG